jgi:hypothetical protein
MSLAEYPELKEVFDKLQAKKENLRKQSQPFRDEYERIQREISILEVRARELAASFQAIEMPAMADIDQQLSAIAKAAGGIMLSQSSPTTQPPLVKVLTPAEEVPVSPHQKTLIEKMFGR